MNHTSYTQLWTSEGGCWMLVDVGMGGMDPGFLRNFRHPFGAGKNW